MRVCPECNTRTEDAHCPKDGRPTVEESKLAVRKFRDPLVGTTIADKYLIEERVGAGGFGAVYRAKHAETGGDVAMKLVRSELVEDESIIRRFYIEAQNTHRLSHPNTVRLSDFGQTLQCAAGAPRPAALHPRRQGQQRQGVGACHGAPPEA